MMLYPLSSDIPPFDLSSKDNLREKKLGKSLTVKHKNFSSLLCLSTQVVCSWENLPQFISF